MNAEFQHKQYGVTTDSYTQNTVSVNVLHNDIKSISVKNTDGANGLKYKIIAYFDKKEETEKILKSEIALTSGSIFNLMVNQNQYDHIKVFLINNVSTTPATWLVCFNLQ